MTAFLFGVVQRDNANGCAPSARVVKDDCIETAADAL
jgi:hypothetical protein